MIKLIKKEAKGGFGVMADNKEKIDDDILQCREDILRSANIEPSSEKSGEKKSDSIIPAFDTSEPKQPDADTGQTEKTVPQKPSELMEAVVRANKTSKIEKAGPSEKQAVKPENDSGKSEIPKFDLAKQIIVKQRTISTTRRMGPEANIEPLHKPQTACDGNGVDQLVTAAPEQNRIISEIVARDIERLLSRAD